MLKKDVFTPFLSTIIKLLIIKGIAMAINKETRRRHISFKNNIQDKDLLKFFDEKSEVYGRSNYIKILIQQAMFKEQIGKNK